MEVIATRGFAKQLKNVPHFIQNSIRALIAELKEAETVGEIGSIEKLKGFKQFYKIRFGDYRVGIEFVKPTLVLISVMHRGSFYFSFPPDRKK